MGDSKELGRWGETLACSYLEKSGYKILDRNWRYSRNEVDVIAMDGEIMVFIEVKTRSSYYFGFPENSVNSKKQKAIIRTSDQYIFEMDHKGESRFDIICITKEQGHQKVEHFKDAFYPHY